MSDVPQVIHTLRTKATRLESHIGKLTRDLEQARSDLSHVNATIRLFEVPQEGEAFPALMNLDRLFKRREVGDLCHEALQAGPQSTRDLAAYIIRKRGWDETDRHLKTSVALRIVHTLRMQERRGKVARAGKRGNAIVWVLAAMPAP